MTGSGGIASKGERGMALLSVLLLVAVMAIITTLVLDRVNLAIRLASNADAMDRARFMARGAEQSVAEEIRRRLALSPSRTVDTGGWLGTPLPVPLEGMGDASATVRISDGGNCFNLNSVVQGSPGQYVTRPSGMAQFSALMVSLGTDRGEADAMAMTLADWIDSNDVAQPGGAEDLYYLGQTTPYRTSGQLLVDRGELLAMKGMTSQLYERIAPWVCTLPDPVLSPINVNTLAPEQAPLLVMLAPQRISLARARAIIASRPQLGFARIADFWRPLSLSLRDLGSDVETQPQIVSRWFRIELEIVQGKSRFVQTSLVDAQLSPARVIARREGLF
ncbi:MAG: type II secretion system minor pseudopilin GspK [Blastomonas sp.]